MSPSFGSERYPPGPESEMRSRRLIPLVAVAIAAMLLPTAASARSLQSLILYVYFGYNAQIAMDFSDGSPVGTTSGSPTVIPAGYYTLALEQPGCVQVPSFELQGPGVSITDNMSGGDVTSHTATVDFLPNSTYVWRNGANPSVAYTFVTSSQVLGTQPPSALVATSTGARANRPTTSSDLVGSAIVPFRGTIDAVVTTKGKLTVAFGGKSVASLRPGRYRIAVTDRSSVAGLLLRSGGRKLSIAKLGFTGKRVTAVTLTRGRWTFAPRAGAAGVSVRVD